MKALVMYESMFGNSERIAHAVADGLAEHIDVVTRDVTTSPGGEVPHGTDLLVVGGPTHAFSMTRPGTREDAIHQGAGQGLASRGLREWLAGLDPDLHGLPAATFDTRVSRVRKLPGSAARSAARVLRRHRVTMLVQPESFFVDDVAGPLAEDEDVRARAWGEQVAALLIADGDRTRAR
jgi:flavodoxin